MNYTADLNPVCCFQLRYLQTLNNISAEKNSTIVFPVPVDIISQMLGRFKGDRGGGGGGGGNTHHRKSSSPERKKHVT